MISPSSNSQAYLWESSEADIVAVAIAMAKATSMGSVCRGEISRRTLFPIYHSQSAQPGALVSDRFCSSSLESMYAQLVQCLTGLTPAPTESPYGKHP